jgi:hypothetical protein
MIYVKDGAPSVIWLILFGVEATILSTPPQQK